MELNRENIRKIRGLILFTIVVLIGLWKYEILLNILRFILNMVFPFLLGAAIAFIVNVPMHFIEQKLFGEKQLKGRKMLQKLGRPISLILTLFFVIGIIGLVMFVVVPELANTIMNLGTSIQNFIPKVQTWAESLFRNNQEIVTWINGLEFNWEKMLQSALDFFKNGAGSVLDSTFAAAKSIISGITTFFIAFVFACYILLQKEKLNVQVRKVMYAFISKRRVEVILEICSLTYKTFSSFLTGQCLEAVILGTMFFLVMTIIRMPYALLVGVLISFTALIPIFGAFIGCAVGALLIFMINPMQALVFVAVFLVLQQIEGNLIYPHVVGGSVGLPSIWVLAAVSIGASLMGIVGMLIFIPIVSVLYALFREVVYVKLKANQIEFDENDEVK